MLPNTTVFTRSELVEMFGSENLFNLPEKIIGVSTDTRTLVKDNIFIALKGENFDGHDVIGVAKGKGASVLLIEKKSVEKLSTEIESYPHILVESTLRALGILGKYHRNRLNLKIIAIAGAAGKTSTKDLTAHLLSQKFITHKTEANYNNQIGVPLTLLQLTSKHEAAVIEIGTNEPGEIEILAGICNPSLGVITNIGKEHLEKLIDLDGVEQEETALFRELSNSGGKILINMDDERLRQYAEIYPDALQFGIDHPASIEAKVQFNDQLQPTLTFSSLGFKAQMQTIGLAAAYNAIAAASVGIGVGMTNEEIRLGLESYTAPEAHGYGRMNLEATDNYTIINDCYNANPESMLIALKTLQLFPTTGKRIAVLGDMRELGESAASEHKEIITKAVEMANIVILFGDEMTAAAANAQYVHKAATKHDCAKIIRSILSDGDVILIKGSRGMRMEEVISELRNSV